MKQMQLKTSFKEHERHDPDALPANMDMSTVLDPMDEKNKRKKKFDIIGV